MWVLNSSTTIIKDDKINYVLVIGSDISELKKQKLSLNLHLMKKRFF